MHIAVIFHRDHEQTLQALGRPNQEIIAQELVDGVIRGLEQAGHRVTPMHGDKRLVERLEVFLAEARGASEDAMAFNLAYGIQGRDRYTHVPAVLEMLGVPYVGSGPGAHSFALDKEHAKISLRSHGVPTPDFAIVEDVEAALPRLRYPLIVKPKREAGSLGLRLCPDEEGLRATVHELMPRFQQPLLVEEYIDGAEIFAGVLGNGESLQVFPPVELVFEEGERIFSRADKDSAHTGGKRRWRMEAPADLPEDTVARIETVAKRAFQALECNDLARIDIRIDFDGTPQVLEVNSIPGLDRAGPYARAAALAGYSFPELLDRLVRVARQRYRRLKVPAGGMW